MNRFCEECGAKLEPEENFCPFCGEKIIREEIPAKTPGTPSFTEKNSYMIHFAALIFFLIVGVAFIMGKNSNEVSLGGLSLGMSKEEADRKFGAGRFGGRDGFFYGDVYVQFTHGDAGVIKYMFCGANNKSVGTGRGVHIGSTFEDVVKAYGKNYSYYRSDYISSITYEFEKITFSFNFNALDQVTAILLFTVERR